MVNKYLLLTVFEVRTVSYVACSRLCERRERAGKGNENKEGPAPSRLLQSWEQAISYGPSFFPSTFALGS